MRRAHERHVADALRCKLHAAVNEREHEDFAQRRIGLDEIEQLFARQLNDLARFAGDRAHQRPAAEDQVGLSGELAGAVHGDQRIASGPVLDDLDLTAGHDKKRDQVVAGLDEDLTTRDRTDDTRVRNPCDLRRCQRWKEQRLMRGVDERG
jgi:hypothetical protein